MFQKLKNPIYSTLGEIQSVNNPVFAFIPATKSRDCAEKVNSQLLNDDSSTYAVINRILSSMTNVFADLINAKYSNLLDADQISLIHDRAPRSNSHCEGLLGIASRLNSTKGRQHPENREALVLACSNRTMEYLSKKPLSWQIKIVADAWKKAPAIANKHFEDREQDRLNMQQKLQQVNKIYVFFVSNYIFLDYRIK